MINVVVISKRAQKQLSKVPIFIINKLETWVDAIEREGLENVRKLQGYHDEPLKGQRLGQRSIRLNRSYRVIYTVHTDHSIEFVSIEEVTKHDY